jgi:hypothetical protein
MRVVAGSSWLLLCWLGCSGDPNRLGVAEDYGYEGDTYRVWVRGPWPRITPSNNIDDVIDQLCPAIMELPGAQLRAYGQEYCGAIYSLGDGVYYSSHPSPLGELAPRSAVVEKRKTCYPPRSVRDARGRVFPSADFHSHPWAPSGMAPVDRQARTQLWLIRIQFDTACRIQKLIPHVAENRPGELYERQGKHWKLIGRILPEDKTSGRVTTVNE